MANQSQASRMFTGVPTAMSCDWNAVICESQQGIMKRLFFYYSHLQGNFSLLKIVNKTISPLKCGTLKQIEVFF